MPVAVTKAKSDVVGEAVVFEEEIDLIATGRAINVIRTTSTENAVPPLGKNSGKVVRLGPFCEIVIVSELGVAKTMRTNAEIMLDGVGVHGDLRLELVKIMEEGEGVIVCLADDFALSCRDHILDGIDEVGFIEGSLFEPGAGDTETDSEIFAALDFTREKSEHWAVGFLGDFSEDSLIILAVLVGSIEIIRGASDVKNRVLAIA